ncbi:MAG: small-conductance mechanosensitive ion channel-like protein [Rhodocyclaceae bacterium]|nr:small-conductance mechanosensitive ion channel-like protein [Rhodocyclaceae bacterium]
MQDWGTAFLTSFAGAMTMFFSAIPKILGFVVILIAGWFIASLIARGVVALLNAVKFNSFADRAGLSDFVHKVDKNANASGMFGVIVKWFVRLIALVVAFDALGLPAVSGVLQQLLMWLPNLVVALVALMIGGLAANALGGLVRGAAAEGGLERPDFLAKVARIAVWAFAIVVAVNQIGIATQLVDALFMATVGAIALALALSFGLGGRETAGKIVQRWYEKGQQKAPQMAQAAAAATNDPAAGFSTEAFSGERRHGPQDRRNMSHPPIVA